MVPATERPPSRAARWVLLVFPHPFDRMAIRRLPVHAICEAREQAPTRCLYLAWHCDSRSCRIVLAEAAQEDLDDLVDDEQGDG